MNRVSRSRRMLRQCSTSVVCAAILSACGRSEDGSDAAARVSVHEVTSGPAPNVEVRGLGRIATRHLSSLAPNDTTWRRLVAVYVERAGIDSGADAGVPRNPPVIGRYSASDDRVRFEPRFPFAPGVAYRVEVDTAAVARLTSSAGVRPSGATRLVHGFTLP